MKILIVAATEEEITLLRTLSTDVKPDFLVTGVGMVSTTYELSKKLQEKKYDIVLNCGLAGSFDRSIPLGEVVQVIEDTFSELGAEDGNNFLSIEKIGLEGKDTFYSNYFNSGIKFMQVKSITVNTVHGNNNSISNIQKRLNPQLESMEGAAVFFVCEKENIPCIQLRAVSNYVEKRNKSAWNIPLALNNLAEKTTQFLNDLQKSDSNTTVNIKNTNNSFTLGFSPCPNDTFMFDALVNGRIDTNGLKFRVELEDIESLNLLALKGKLDVTKLSFAVYLKVMEHYELLTSGSALGNGVGPLLVSKKIFNNPDKEIQSVAIPGNNTTAGYLLKMFYPEIKDVRELIFSEIEDAVLTDKVDAGVIIHESRFTYAQKGLHKISDLGELWEKKTGQPIPLGGIAIRRSLDENIKKKINRLMKSSVEYAFAHPADSEEYVKIHAQEMSEDVRKKHIQLYVNEYSVELGETGKKTIACLIKANNSFSKNIFADGS
jgi:1,4-dihydroxy-6-naphthoate synthase